MISAKQYRNLLIKQNQLNEIVNINWKTELSVFNFAVAMTVEANECIEHCTYKWWKKEKVEIKQAQMEVVDCYFFYLSALILLDAADLGEANMLADSEYDIQEFNKEEAVICAMKFIENASSTQLPNLIPATTSALWKLAKSVGLSSSSLYDMYMAKLVLNIFRQNNGYTDGSYVKIWNGLEDNEVLHKLMETIQDPVELETQLGIQYNNLKVSDSENV